MPVDAWLESLALPSITSHERRSGFSRRTLGKSGSLGSRRLTTGSRGTCKHSMRLSLGVDQAAVDHAPAAYTGLC
jgi:hypothetical protein